MINQTLFYRDRFAFASARAIDDAMTWGASS